MDASAVKAQGPGLDPNYCRAGVPLNFKIDATKSGEAPLDVNIRSDRGQLTFINFEVDTISVEIIHSRRDYNLRKNRENVYPSYIK